jgi:5-methylcytosine-specific restriction protein A
MPKLCYSDPKQFHTSAPGRRRSKGQLAREPLCAWCLKDAKTVTATIAHHLHGYSDWQTFMTGELISLCKWHHDREAQRRERGRAPQTVDADGWPT